MAYRIGVFEFDVRLALPGSLDIGGVTAAGWRTAGQRVIDRTGRAAHKRHLCPGITPRAGVGGHHHFRNEVRHLNGGFHRTAKGRTHQPVTDSADAPADAVLGDGAGNDAGSINGRNRGRSRGCYHYGGNTGGVEVCSGG